MAINEHRELPPATGEEEIKSLSQKSLKKKEKEMEIRPLSKLGKPLRLLLKTNIAITLIAVLIGLYDYYTYTTLPAGFDSNETIFPSDIAVAVVGVVQTVLLIIIGIVFLLWIYRINKNLHTLSDQQMRFSPGWSVGWYFIPIANLFKPYQVMKEIWYVSQKNKTTTHSLVSWWWFLWIVSAIVGRLAAKLSMRAETTEDYAISALTYVASDGIDIILNIVALILVTRIETAYYENFSEQNAPLRQSPDTPDSSS